MKTAVLDWINPKYTITEFRMVYGRNGQKLAQYENTNGYRQVNLFRADGERRQFLVARLVLRAFTKVEGIQANHKNGLRHDNRLKNLEWVSASENARHAYRVLGRKHSKPALGKFGAENPSSKRVQQYTKNGTLVKEWGSIQEAARQGFNAGNISAVCRGLRKTHASFIWKFVRRSKEN
jgi:hypothetical protein